MNGNTEHGILGIGGALFVQLFTLAGFDLGYNWSDALADVLLLSKNIFFVAITAVVGAYVSHYVKKCLRNR